MVTNALLDQAIAATSRKQTALYFTLSTLIDIINARYFSGSEIDSTTNDVTSYAESALYIFQSFANNFATNRDRILHTVNGQFAYFFMLFQIKQYKFLLPIP